MRKLAVAVDFGKTRLRVALVDRKGEIQRVTEVDSRHFSSSADVTNAILTCVDSITGGREGLIIGVGIGSTGAVDSENGIVLSSGSLPYLRDYDIAAQIRNRLNLPTAVVNDVSAAGLGEAVYGPYGRAERIVFLNFGTGVGAALVSGGRLERGAHGSLGLISSIPVPPDGRTVNECVGGKALAPYLGEDVSVGDGGVAVRNKGVGVAVTIIGFIAGLCDPHAIAVGGGVWLQNNWFRERVHRGLSEAMENQTTGLSMPHVMTARLGDRAGLIGAGHLGLEIGTV
ncbi:ROK family protein [Streptomyces sp. NRRL S-1824]|uniref:ROK family protein n=1 Tax=Streptomyces sp. NRRL S-1824 TaxID=1463889 RepID=UPI00099C9DE3|nr:ROK family protein [Streptomyces sp. NRRL S-1824]